MLIQVLIAGNDDTFTRMCLQEMYGIYVGLIREDFREKNEESSAHTISQA